MRKVKLRQTRLELGLMITSGGSTIPVFIQTTQPGRPSVGRRNECWRRFRSCTTGEETASPVFRSSGPCDQDCWHAGLSRLKAVAVNLSWPMFAGVEVSFGTLLCIPKSSSY